MKRKKSSGDLCISIKNRNVNKNYLVFSFCNLHRHLISVTSDCFALLPQQGIALYEILLTYYFVDSDPVFILIVCLLLQFCFVWPRMMPHIRQQQQMTINWHCSYDRSFVRLCHTQNSPSTLSCLHVVLTCVIFYLLMLQIFTNLHF